jgi:hypothetical protein
MSNTEQQARTVGNCVKMRGYVKPFVDLGPHKPSCGFQLNYKLPFEGKTKHKKKKGWKKMMS